MTVLFRPSTLRSIALGLGGSAFSLACSFGEIQGELVTPETLDEVNVTNGQGADDDGVGADVQDIQGEDTLVAGSGDEDNDSGDNNSQVAASPMGGGMMSDFGNDEFITDLALQAQGVLKLNCAGCHSNGVALGGVSEILDYQALVNGGKLVLGNKEDSTLFSRMAAGTMPPASSSQRPSDGDIALVGEFIDGLSGGENCEPVAFMTMDDKYELMLDDILAQDIDDREFIRYLGADYASNAGVCGSALQRQRYSLFKLINSVSLNSRITQPVAIDSDQLIFRIDIRDYNWDRAIDLEDDGIVDFEDAWLATLDQVGEYAIEFEGAEADQLKLQTGVAVPFLSINAWVQDVTTGDLYYALIDGRQNINATQLDLGVDEQESIDEGTLWRAGFKTSGVSKQDRNLTRQEVGNYRGSYWLSQDFADVGSESSFADPLGFAFNGGEAIYNLPNGLQAYYATDDDGNRAVEVPVNIVIDPAQNNGVVTNAASCHSCHNGGMIPFRDTVRDYVLTNKVGFDAETIEGVEEQFPVQADFNRVVEEDSERHLSAVERAGVPRGTPDAVSRVYLQFQLGDIDASTAAGELGIELDDLLGNMGLLDPVLAPLSVEGGVVDRAKFTEVFFDSLCRMQSFSENRPANCI